MKYNKVLHFLNESFSDNIDEKNLQEILADLKEDLSKQFGKPFSGQSAEFSGQATWVLKKYTKEVPGFFLQLTDDYQLVLAKRIVEEDDSYTDEDLLVADIDTVDEVLSIIDRAAKIKSGILKESENGIQGFINPALAMLADDFSIRGFKSNRLPIKKEIEVLGNIYNTAWDDEVYSGADQKAIGKKAFNAMQKSLNKKATDKKNAIELVTSLNKYNPSAYTKMLIDMEFYGKETKQFLEK